MKTIKVILSILMTLFLVTGLSVNLNTSKSYASSTWDVLPYQDTAGWTLVGNYYGNNTNLDMANYQYKFRVRWTSLYIGLCDHGLNQLTFYNNNNPSPGYALMDIYIPSTFPTGEILQISGTDISGYSTDLDMYLYRKPINHNAVITTNLPTQNGAFHTERRAA